MYLRTFYINKALANNEGPKHQLINPSRRVTQQRVVKDLMLLHILLASCIDEGTFLQAFLLILKRTLQNK